MTDQLFYDAIDLLKELIATPSVSRSESAAADIVYNFAVKNIYGVTPQRIGNNIYIADPTYDSNRKTLLLNSHIDTVPAAVGWTRDPFQPTLNEVDGKLYGLGSNDAGASLVSLLSAFRALIQKPRSYNLIFVASAEEEVSGKDGLTAVLPILPKVDCAIVGEPTEMRPAIAEKGLMVLDCTAHGVAGHAARNEGVNAIYKAIDSINRLRNFTFENESPTLGPVKVSTTIINGGTKHNVIPDTCQFTVDVRTTDAYSNLETLEILRKVAGDGIEVTPRSTRLNPSSIPADHPIVKRFEMLGLEPFGSPTLSDGALMAWHKVKAGPGQSSRSHTPDEYIYINEIREAIEIYIKILTDLNL